MPVLTFTGFLIYACWSYIFPNSVYTGLLIGTILFSTSSGLAEILLSPLIATIPVADPAREMSKFHSVYAWGTVCVVIFSSSFLALFGTHNWQILAHIFLIIPLISAFLFFTTGIPAMETTEKVTGVRKRFKRKGLWLCVFAIFLGSIAENTMALWSSTFLERAFNIPKLWGDVFGVALFGLMLGFGRLLYGKIGKNLERTLIVGCIGAAACYFVAAVSSAPIVGLLCCAMTGFCASMLWPGCLVVGSERFPDDGVFIFALLAAGGDLGISVGPQLVGLVTDFAIINPKIMAVAEKFNLTAEQFGMKVAMLIITLFSAAAIPLFVQLKRTKGKE